MNNYYIGNDYKYNEIIETLEDYIYGSYTKCTIPSILALANRNSIKNGKIDTTNIMNKDIKSLGISSYTPQQYISVFIPKDIFNSEDLKEFIYKQSKSEEELDFTPIGKKGDKFIATFVGGDITKCNIIGRYYG